jgi:nucleoside-diphosphate-sugar epimerase
MKKILVLGSSGQIGSGLVAALAKRNYSVAEFDIVNNKEHDLRIYSDLLRKEISSSEFVFFLAFDVGGSRYLNQYQDTFDFIDNNIKIMDITFNELKNQDKKFIFASSQMANMPFSTYGLLKLLGEKYCLSINNGRFVRFWNVYGVETIHNKFHVISDFIEMAKKDSVIKMQTDGEELRDFLHADDCSDALITLMENFGDISNKNPLHIASFEFTKIIDIAKFIASEFGADIVKGKTTDTVQNGELHEPSTYIYKYWKPSISLKQGIRSIIKNTK